MAEHLSNAPANVPSEATATQTLYTPEFFIATDATETTGVRRAISYYGELVGGIGFKPDLLLARDSSLRSVTKMVRDLSGVSVYIDARLSAVPYAMVQDVFSVLNHARPNYLTISSELGERAFAEAKKGRDRFLLSNEASHATQALDPKLIVSSYPSDMSREECFESKGCSPEEFGKKVTRWALDAGMDGVECGSWQLEAAAQVVREADEDEFMLIADGIRRDDDIEMDRQGARDKTGTKHDVCTPSEARKRGATHLMLGKTVTSRQISDRQAAFGEVVESWRSAA
jgi:orotidine-5'-phosphate decarboxylase